VYYTPEDEPKVADKPSQGLHTLSMHVNLDKGDNFDQVFKQLTRQEGIENTLDTQNLSHLLEQLDYSTRNQGV